MKNKKGSSWENPFDNIRDAFDASAKNTGEPRIYFVDCPDANFSFYELDAVSPFHELSERMNGLLWLIAKKAGLVWMTDRLNKMLSRE